MASKNIAKSSKPAKKPKRSPRRKRDIIVAWSIVAVFVLAYDLSGVGGNLKFYTKWITCGQKPVHSVGQFMNPIVFYKESPSFSLLRGSPDYFCTPYDAEMAGYSADDYRYHFPNLTPQEYRCIYREFSTDEDCPPLKR